MSAGGVGDRFVRACRQAVEAYHAAAHVDRVAQHVDTFGFASVFASAALGASVGVDVDVHGAVSCDDSEDCSGRAYGVAYQASASPCGDCDRGGGCQGRRGAERNSGPAYAGDDFGVYSSRFDPLPRYDCRDGQDQEYA